MEMELFEGTEEMEAVNEFEVNNTEATEETVEEIEVATVEAKHVNKVGNDMVKGLLIGLGTGLAVGAAAWFHERNKRLAILEQLEYSTDVATAIGKGNTTLSRKKKFSKKDQEINLAEVVMNNPTTYTNTIMENIGKVKFLSKKERQRWEAVMENIISLSLAWYEAGIVNETIGTEIPEAEVTEILVENK